MILTGQHADRAYFSSSIGSLPTRPLVGPKGTGHRTLRPFGNDPAQGPGRLGTEVVSIAGTAAAGPDGPAKLWS